MKRFISMLCLTALLLIPGCAGNTNHAQVAATTQPVYDFTVRLCENTDITVTKLINESVSCLHDYSLSVAQVKAAQAAQLVILSGGGLEDFMTDYLAEKTVREASVGIPPLESCHDHEHDHGHDHSHSDDPHFWLSPANAMIMSENICTALEAAFPRHKDTLRANLAALRKDLQALLDYGTAQLSDLSFRELITFHDGFAYFAHCFDLTVLEAVEEESGSEASAQELKHLIELVREHQLPAVFTETNGSTASAELICAETGITAFRLDMAMSTGYFDAMYHNIKTVKEALG